MKKFALIMLLTISFSLISTPEVEAKRYVYAYIFADGCVGTHTVHTALWGLFVWDTYERISCP